MYCTVLIRTKTGDKKKKKNPSIFFLLPSFCAAPGIMAFEVRKSPNTRDGGADSALATTIACMYMYECGRKRISRIHADPGVGGEGTCAAAAEGQQFNFYHWTQCTGTCVWARWCSVACPRERPQNGHRDLPLCWSAVPVPPRPRKATTAGAPPPVAFIFGRDKNNNKFPPPEKQFVAKSKRTSAPHLLHPFPVLFPRFFVFFSFFSFCFLVGLSYATTL